VDVVFIGSCTNSRIEDIRVAASIVKGRKVADGVRAMVVPGSGLVKAQAEEEGLDRILREAGFEWREAGCSMCLGMNPDKLKPGQRAASTSNRNFEGRQGPGGRTHLLSPAMAAAAALAGRLADVRDFQPKGAEAMQAFTTLTGIAAPMPAANVDTDKIIPARFLKSISRSGFGKNLFHSMRFREDGSENPDFVLNQPALPQRGGADRLRELRLRLVPRARALGAARLRHPLRHRARLRRHLPQQLLQERHPAGAPAARGVRALMDDARLGANARLTVDLERRSWSAERREIPFEVDPLPAAPAAERPGRHRPDAPARRRHRRLRSEAARRPTLALRLRTPECPRTRSCSSCPATASAPR
jgi:hypothetical protein